MSRKVAGTIYFTAEGVPTTRSLQSHCTAISRHGVVSGYFSHLRSAKAEGDIVAFVWRAGAVDEIGSGFYPRGVNDLGDVVGESNSTPAGSLALIATEPLVYRCGRMERILSSPDWTPNTPRPYYQGADGPAAGVFPGASQARRSKREVLRADAYTWCFGGAFGINDSGAVAGRLTIWTNEAGVESRAICTQPSFVWCDGTLAVLPTPEGFRVSAASYLTEAGLVVGFAAKTPDREGVRTKQAVMWRAGESILIPPLDGYEESEAAGATDDGRILCSSWRNDRSGLSGIDNPFRIGVRRTATYVWHNGTVERALDPDTVETNGVDLARACAPRGISNEGWVVGQARSTDGDRIGFLWRDGVIHDINQLVTGNGDIHIEDAVGVSDTGQIACNGRRGSEAEAILLTCVP